MASNNTSLEHGKEYSIAELFGTDHRKIIIPDFQRDYCWGDKNYGEKSDTDIVSGFIQTLKEEYRNGTIVLGKIDVYQNPANHIYLTDGQQRLTSIFLLLGMLHRLANGNTKTRLKKCLISDFEETDDKEPYLQYSIRESSVFFLRDLVNEFFIEGQKIKVSDIKRQPWFFNDYKLDPTISSMRNALQTIETELLDKDLNIQEFSAFILDNLKIQYFDVVDRKHGEERFVIINTTGKSLTTTENIKPILLGNVNTDSFSGQWEERETYFWLNRRKEKPNEELIADKGVEEFMTWCIQIYEYQDVIDLTKKAKEYLKTGKNKDVLDLVNKLFISLKELIALIHKEKFQKQLSFINGTNVAPNIVGLRNLNKDKYQNILLPLLSFMTKFGFEENDIYLFLRRLRKNYFDSNRKKRNTNYVDWRYILQFIDLSDNPRNVLQFIPNEELDLKNIPNVQLNEWYTSEEKIKQELKKDHLEEIEKWEDHHDFMGDISFLLNVHRKINGDNILCDYNSLNQYWLIYTRLDNCLHVEKCTKNDFNLSNYYRLYRLLIGCQDIGHIDNCAWDIEGCFFSYPNLRHLYNDNFINLCSSTEDELLSTIKNEIYSIIEKDNLFEINEDNFQAKKFLKAWLALKVFHAEKAHIQLNFVDWNGIAAHTDITRNKINKESPFSLGNAICGYAIKSPANRIDYASSKEWWLNPTCYDSPFTGIELSNFQNRKVIPINLEANEQTIDSLISEWKINQNELTKETLNIINE